MQYTPPGYPPHEVRRGEQTRPPDFSTFDILSSMIQTRILNNTDQEKIAQKANVIELNLNLQEGNHLAPVPLQCRTSPSLPTAEEILSDVEKSKP